MTRALARSTAVAIAVISAGCSPLDQLGVEELVTERATLQPPPLVEDDRIEDKHPVYDPSYTIQEEFNRCLVTLNKSASVTKLDIQPFAKHDAHLQDRLFPTYVDALLALGDRPVMPSMELIQAWLKPFNDGLYAAVELAAQEGSEASLVNKRALLDGLLSELVARAGQGAPSSIGATEAAAFIAGSMLVAGRSPQAPAGILADAQQMAASFEGQPAEARPIGFYTWTPELGSIFKQDRFLQSQAVKPSFAAFAASAVAIQHGADLETRYRGVLDLYAGLTNPYYHHPLTVLFPFVPDEAALGNLGAAQSAYGAAYPETQLEPECRARLAFLPASDSAETELFRDLFCVQRIELPPDVTMIDVLIGMIRSGQLDLTPTPESGWYDRQTWALETLLVPEKAPEKDHLFLTRRYKEKLIETFKTIITQNRETHAKQADRSSSEEVSAPYVPPEFDLYPKLPVEPFPTFYLRTARAYDFLHNVLTAVMGEAFLSESSRLLESGHRHSKQLGAELEDKARALYGLHIVAARSIGMHHQMTPEELQRFPAEQAEARGRSRLDSLGTDADVASDPRVIVPVHYDPNTDTWRHWAVIGARLLTTHTSFYPGFEPEIVGTSGCKHRSTIPHAPFIVIGQMVEVAIPAKRPPLTRAEFRQLCDSKNTAEEIVAALEGR